MKLSPPERIHEELKRDYKQMNEMCYGAVPEFAETMAVIEGFEKEFNQAKVIT